MTCSLRARIAGFSDLAPRGRGLLLLAALCSLSASATAAPPSGPAAALKAPKLTPQQRSRLGLRLMRDVMIASTAPHPHQPEGGGATPPTATQKPAEPRGGELNDGGERLVAIVRAMSSTSCDVNTLKSAWSRAHPGPVREALALYLAGKGHPEAAEDLGRLAANPARPYYLREAGIRAAAQLAVQSGDSAVGRVLAEVAVRDPVTRLQAKKPGVNSAVLEYPLRREAVSAIRTMSGAGLLLESFVTAAAERTVVEIPLPKSAAKPPSTSLSTSPAAGAAAK